MRALARWIRQRESRVVRGLPTGRLLARYHEQGAGLLFTLPLFWASYPLLAFDLFGFNPDAQISLATTQSWQLIALLGLHLGLCHWLVSQLARLHWRLSAPA